MENNKNGAALKVRSDIRAAAEKFDLINRGDHIVLGLSGGPDSVCLFFALYSLMDELDITISTVHINHKFRPGAAEEDQKYVEDLCAKLGVRQTSIVRDCNEVANEYGITSEEAGRRVRYEAFDDEADYVVEHLGKRKDQVKIAVAHNAEDQAETLLFRLIRGTGTDGLAGIERKRLSEKGYTIIRPILGIKRSDIEAFCEENGLDPRIDHTNLEPIYSRNKIRLGLIPYISENFNENITETLNRLATIAAEDKDYIWQQVEETYSKAKVSARKTEVVLSLDDLAGAHKAVRHRMIMKAFDEVGLVRDIGATHLEAADSIIERGTTGKTAEFPYGYQMVTRYDEVAFKAPYSEKKLCLDMSIVSVHEWNAYLIAKRGTPKNYAGFDYEALCEARNRERGDEVEIPEMLAELRTKKPGDYIALSGGRKKIQDLLVDSKVPRDIRDSIMMIASGSEILFIPGEDSGLDNAALKKGRYSSKYCISGTTKEVLTLEVTQKMW